MAADFAEDTVGVLTGLRESKQSPELSQLLQVVNMTRRSFQVVVVRMYRLCPPVLDTRGSGLKQCMMSCVPVLVVPRQSVDDRCFSPSSESGPRGPISQENSCSWLPSSRGSLTREPSEYLRVELPGIDRQPPFHPLRAIFTFVPRHWLVKASGGVVFIGEMSGIEGEVTRQLGPRSAHTWTDCLSHAPYLFSIFSNPKPKWNERVETTLPVCTDRTLCIRHARKQQVGPAPISIVKKQTNLLDRTPPDDGTDNQC